MEQLKNEYETVRHDLASAFKKLQTLVKKSLVQVFQIMANEEKQQKALLDCYEAFSLLDRVLTQLERDATQELPFALNFDTEHPDTYLQLFQRTKHNLNSVRLHITHAKICLEHYRDDEKIDGLGIQEIKANQESLLESSLAKQIATLSNQVNSISQRTKQLEVLLIVVIAIAFLELVLIFLK